MIKRTIYRIGMWMAQVYSNWAEFIICMGGIAFLLALCSLAHCEPSSSVSENETIAAIVNKTNDDIVNFAKGETVVNKKQNWFALSAGVVCLGMGVWDLTDNNLQSTWCGGAMAITGTVLVLISF